MRDSAQNMDRKSNLKSVIKAKTNTSLVEFVHMTERICWALSKTFSTQTEQLLLRQMVQKK